MSASLNRVRETIHCSVAAGAMASCSHRTGDGPKAGEVVAELPNTTCQHPAQPIAAPCTMAGCPIAAKLTPVLVSNLGETLSHSILQRVGVVAGPVRNLAATAIGALAGRKSADAPGGVDLQ